MSGWRSLLQSVYPEGLYFKDLSQSDISSVDGNALAAVSDPVAIRISSKQLSSVVESLVAAGIGPATECAYLSRRETYGTLGDIATRVRLSEECGYLLIADLALLKKRKPLTGKNILITRSARQSGALAELLKRQGARVINVPAIEIVVQNEELIKLREAFAEIGSYSWLIFTSTNAVDIVNELLHRESLTWEIFEHLKIACIGKSTAAAVSKSGGTVALSPKRFQAEDLAEELIAAGIAGKQILLPRAAGARRVLPEMLQLKGAAVNEFHIYRTEIPLDTREKIGSALAKPIDFITFTSSSTVHHFVQVAKGFAFDFSKTYIASIGPITTATLRDYGLKANVEATEFTIPGLVDAMLRFLRK